MLLVVGGILLACGAKSDNKTSNQEDPVTDSTVAEVKDTILLKEHNELLGRDMTVKLLNGSKIVCDTNTIEVVLDGIDSEEIVLAATGGTLEKQPTGNSHFLIPDCNQDSLILNISHKNDTLVTLLSTVDLNQFK